MHVETNKNFFKYKRENLNIKKKKKSLTPPLTNTITQISACLITGILYVTVSLISLTHFRLSMKGSTVYSTMSKNYLSLLD